jgi:hypothetical protein
MQHEPLPSFHLQRLTRHQTPLLIAAARFDAANNCLYAKQTTSGLMPMRCCMEAKLIIILLNRQRERRRWCVFFSKKHIYFLLLCVKIIFKNFPVDYHFVSNVAKLIEQAISCVPLPQN